MVWIFFKVCQENYSSLMRIWQEQQVLDMKTNKHFWSYLTHFFLEWEMFQIKLVEKMKIHILCSITFFWKLCLLYDNVGEYYTAWQVTDDNIIWCMHWACLITNATDTHLEYVTLTAFPWQQWLHECTSVLHIYIHCLSFFLQNRAVYDTMYKNSVEPDRPQTTIWLLRIACWILKVTHL